METNKFVEKHWLVIYKYENTFYILINWANKFVLLIHFTTNTVKPVLRKRTIQGNLRMWPVETGGPLYNNISYCRDFEKWPLNILTANIASK